MQLPDGGDYHLVVAMHPDDAPDHAMLYASVRRMPAAICPSCVRQQRGRCGPPIPIGPGLCAWSAWPACSRRGEGVPSADVASCA